MTTFHNIHLNKVVKPILETLNANEVIVYVWFIHSRIKHFETGNVQQNNSNLKQKTKIIRTEPKIRFTT